jgi:hypothetical protein
MQAQGWAAAQRVTATWAVAEQIRAPGTSWAATQAALRWHPMRLGSGSTRAAGAVPLAAPARVLVQDPAQALARAPRLTAYRFMVLAVRTRRLAAVRVLVQMMPTPADLAVLLCQARGSAEEEAALV